MESMYIVGKMKRNDDDMSTNCERRYKELLIQKLKDNSIFWESFWELEREIKDETRER